ncbi:MAG: oxidoreductase [Rhodospirillaceae bacterium]|nr:oxidoreductase [Rhodospirillaceae bacterium]|tara:strand:- start:2964 stop:4130 length:1167 start_codon:yes stop_codon:yes gene_type:complete
MATSSRIVVVGGGYAGLTAAARIAEGKTDATVTLIDRKSEFIERIRLHEIAAGSEPRDLGYKDFMECRGGNFHRGGVSGIDLARQLIELEGQDTIAWDTLVYALGSFTDVDSVPGVREHAVSLDDLGECRELFGRLFEAPKGTKLLIVGGGLTAIEAACEFAERFPQLEITLAVGNKFEAHRKPGGLSAGAIEHLRNTFDRLSVNVIVGDRVTSVEKNSAVIGDDNTLPFDLCIWAAGFSVPTLAKESGLAVNDSGQIRTNRSLASFSHANVLAVGDSAEVIAEIGGRCRMSCATGRPMGEMAAKTILGRLLAESSTPFEFGYSFRCISLGREDGLIQFVDEKDCPTDDVWTGKRGARWKEYICQRTLQGIGFDVDIGDPPDTPPARI